MKKYLIAAASFLTFSSVSGQKTEYGLSLSSGLFAYTGVLSASTSFLNYSTNPPSSYTNDPYGSKYGLCYGLSADIKRVKKNHILLGISAGYEVLRSKVSINEVWGLNGYNNYTPAKGQTYLNSGFINLFPNIGYRFLRGKWKLDLSGGFDVALLTFAQESGKAVIANGAEYKSSSNQFRFFADLRPRIQLSVSYLKMGFYVGYCYGFASFTNNYDANINGTYARLIRFGLTYRFK